MTDDNKFIPPNRKSQWMMTIDDLTPEKQENARKSFKEETERYYKQMRELERKEKIS